MNRRALQSKAKTRILRWFDTLHAPKRARVEMARSIDLMFAELADRNDWFEVLTVTLADTEDLPIVLRSPTWRTIPCARELAVSSVVPGWSFGWRNIIKDDFAEDTLSWFLHYARQYIHRSNVAKVLMVAWDRKGRVLHPFGPQMAMQRYGPLSPTPSVGRMLELAEENAYRQWGKPKMVEQTSSVWSRANTLDPHLHQAIFHFLRAQNLLAQGFEMEAVVAFDCVMQSLKGLLMRAKVATSSTTRGELCRTLGIGSRASKFADEGYFLRNNFGAHAGGWRWWDHSELTEEVAPALSTMTRRALQKATVIEEQHRSIHPLPDEWSEWLNEQFEMLWDVVWFDRLRGL